MFLFRLLIGLESVHCVFQFLQFIIIRLLNLMNRGLDSKLLFLVKLVRKKVQLLRLIRSLNLQVLLDVLYHIFRTILFKITSCIAPAVCCSPCPASLPFPSSRKRNSCNCAARLGQSYTYKLQTKYLITRGGFMI